MYIELIEFGRYFIPDSYMLFIYCNLMIQTEECVALLVFLSDYFTITRKLFPLTGVKKSLQDGCVFPVFLFNNLAPLSLSI